VGLVNLEARVRGRGNAYAIIASGGTDYGPFTADVLVRNGATLAVDINTARFAGMDITGKLQQTRAGPFAGNLRFEGSGVSGSAELAAQGKFQRADRRHARSTPRFRGMPGSPSGAGWFRPAWC
jgi:translocation and assembly module TamB